MKLFRIFVLVFMLMPGIVFAIGDTKGDCDSGQIETAFGCINADANTLPDFIQNVYSWALVLGATISVVMLVIAGIQYMTAGGSPDAVTAAKERIFSTLLGMALLLVAAVLFRTIGVGVGILQ